MTLVDSNVLLDVLTEDPAWAGWSSEALVHAFDEGPVVVNPIVYAEVSVGFDRIEELDEALPAAAFVREPLPYPAGFVAGKAFLSYRRSGGTKPAPLPSPSPGREPDEVPRARSGAAAALDMATPPASRPTERGVRPPRRTHRPGRRS